jgi:probable HAF family extracellular repeat protein
MIKMSFPEALRMWFPSACFSIFLLPALLAGCGGETHNLSLAETPSAGAAPSVAISAARNPAGQEPMAQDAAHQDPASQDAAPASSLTENWAIADLGVESGFTSSYATAINNAGQVVGLSYRNDGASGASAMQRIFLYADGVLRGIGPMGNFQADASAINDAGQIAGSAFVPDTTGIPDWHAFLYSEGSLTDLGTLIGSANSHAFDLNNSAQVVGLSAAQGGQYHAFLYSNGSMRDLGTLGGTDSSAAAINDSGQVAGSSATTDGQTHAFLYSNGVMTDLGTLGADTISYASAINNAGQVAGNSYTPGSGASSAFLYGAGRLQALGTLGGGGSGATALNDAGDVVGWSDTGSGGEPHAFLYRDGNMLDLNTLPEVLAAGWELRYAAAINNAGQIAGRGIIGGQERAFLLSPVRQPVLTPSIR